MLDLRGYLGRVLPSPREVLRRELARPGQYLRREIASVLSPALGLIGEDTVGYLSNLGYQRTYLWEVLFPDIANFSGERVGKLCQEINFGDYNMEDTVNMRKGPYHAKFPSKFAIANPSFTFLLTTDRYVMSYIYAWRLLVVNRGLFEPDKSIYARRIEVLLLEPHGEVVATFKLINAFPTALPAFSLSYGKGDNVTASIGFSVDDVEVE